MLYTTVEFIGAILGEFGGRGLSSPVISVASPVF